MKYYPSSCCLSLTSEDSFTGKIKDKDFHCVRSEHPRHGLVVAILPFVGTDAEQRRRAEIIAKALESI